MKTKRGISLIAVLMFMLAATTASLVVFRYVGQENFASGSRLKNNEAYQASQAGLEAVQGWLTNKGADAGALIKQFKDQTTVPKQPVLMINQASANQNTDSLLGRVGGLRKQKFEVYLIGINVDAQPYKLKFLSVGTARDNSKYSQVGIFDVEGLYQTGYVQPPTPPNAPDIPAFFGGINANTQGKFSSAIVNGDLLVNGIETNGNLIVTGNMRVMDNSYMFIGCKNGAAGDFTRDGDLYVAGWWEARGFNVCGDAYIGGLLTTTSNPQFRKNLYADGGIDNNGLRVYENVTLGGNLTAKTSQVTFDGNMVMERTAKISIEDGSKIDVGGSVWSMNDLFLGRNNNDKYGILNMGGAGKSLIVPTPRATSCAGSNAYGCGNSANRYYQYTGVGTDTAHFSSQAAKQNPSAANKPTGANPLEDMASQISDCPKPGGGTYKCVPDPLEVPNDVKQLWLEKGRKLSTLVNAGDSAGIPKSCIRLVSRSPQKDANGNYDSHWLFGDGLSRNGITVNKTDYPSSGDFNNGTYGTGNKYNFARAANDCYDALLANDSRSILYQNGNVGEKFLALVVNNTEEKSPANGDYFKGNFIFSYTANMGTTMKLPATTNNSKVFLYFQEGATANLPLENGCNGLTTPCKRNYFIYSEKDMYGSSGTATINGAIFLANGSKITGNLPDAKIEFNNELYQALSQAGIIKEKKGTTPPALSSSSGGRPDEEDYFIPTTPHLKVNLQSKYANEEVLGPPAYAQPAILVMPRIIYLKPGQITGGVTQLKEYYKVLYLNGAIEPTEPNPENNAVCEPDVNFSGESKGTCRVTSRATKCNGNNTLLLCTNPFQVVIRNNVSSSSVVVSSSSRASSSSAAQLTCTGLAVNGAAITQPAVKCNGTDVNASNYSYIGAPASWASPAAGTYNISVTANSGTCSGITASCGTVTVSPQSTTCDYQPSWCGNKAFSAVTENSTTRPTVGNCLFINNFTNITTSTTGTNTVLINGVTCSGTSTNCANSKPAAKDGGYYVYLSAGAFSTNNANWAVTQGAKRTDCTPVAPAQSSSSVPSSSSNSSQPGGCQFAQSYCPGVAWADIKWGTSYSKPGNGQSACFFVNNQNPTNPYFNQCDGAATCLVNGKTPAECNNNNCGVAKADNGYYLYVSVPSGYGGQINTQNIGNALAQPTCGGSTPSSSSAAAPTITCTVAKTNVTQGENIGPPTITCSSGTLDKSAANFNTTSGSTPTDVNNWRTTGNAYYGTTITGGNAIQVSNVKCGTATVAGNTNCGTVSVAKPTCSGVSGNATVGQTITPTVGCGNATKSGNPTFDGGTGWNASGAGGSYNSTGSKTISLSSVTCDGHSITNITGVSCGTVNVVAVSSSSVSSSSRAASSSSAGGGGGGTVNITDRNEVIFNAGTYTVTCNSGGGQFICAPKNNCGGTGTGFTVQFGGANATIQDWQCSQPENYQALGSCSGGASKTLVVPASKQLGCKNDW